MFAATPGGEGVRVLLATAMEDGDDIEGRGRLHCGLHAHALR